MFKSSILALVLLLIGPAALSWGGRGHYVICESAAHLVKNEDLKEFLLHRVHMMGHLCNVPDTHWRNMGPASDSGTPTHYFEPDLVGKKIEDMPLDFKKVTKLLINQPNLFKENAKVFSVPKELGSSWWRAEQFVRLATSSAKTAKKSKAPANRQEEQNNDLEYNKAVFEMMTFFGLMGHFVGDNAQPFHNTADYDGWNKNHGGIHGFYEEVVVSRLPAGLSGDVVKVAQEQKGNFQFLKAKNPVENMKGLSSVTYAEIDTVLSLDELIKPSALKKEKGMDLKTPAERPTAEVAAAKFQPLITLQMARSASLLAKLWDQAYEQAGKPSLKAYRFYKFPFQPDFVAPDYTE